MKLIVNFSFKEIDQSYVIGLEFLKILTNTYITYTTETTNSYSIAYCKSTTFVITRYDPTSNERDAIDLLSIPILSSSDWPQFETWCKVNKGVDLHIKKKLIDNEAVWWPSIIELLVDDDNEHFFMAKLRDM